MSWAVNDDRFVSYTLFTRWDWLCSSFRLQFYHLACSKFSVELFLFVIFSTFFFVLVQLFFIYQLSSRSLRNHHLTLSFFNINEWCQFIIILKILRFLLSSAKPKTADKKNFDCRNWWYHFRAFVINWYTHFSISWLSSTIVERSSSMSLFSTTVE